MSPYVVNHRDKPWIMLFMGATLTEIGEALAAQPNAEELEVVWHQDGFARALNADEAAELAAAVRVTP